MSTQDDSGGLKTIERALAVLEFVAGAPTAPSVREISVALGHNISSTYNIVNTLLGAGYLSKDQVGAIRVGNRVSLLASALDRNNDRTMQLRPFVERVSASSGETVYLTRKLGDRVVIQLVFEGRQSLRVTGLEVGFSGSEDRRASGKANMAFLSDEQNLSILRSNHSDANEEELLKRLSELQPELEEIRRAGFAFDDEAFEVGVVCIAAPYFNADGSVAGSLAASGPAARSVALRGVIKDTVIEASNNMSNSLGAPPRSFDVGA